MKRIMTFTGWLVMAATLIAGMTACTKENNSIDEPSTTDTPKTYTMTVTASKSTDDATTRALSLGGKTLNATWAAGETVDVYQPKQVLKPGTVSDYHEYYEKVGTLTAQADGATATLSGTVTLGSKTNLTLNYGSPSYDYRGQVGTIADISSNFDYASAILFKSKYNLEDGKITLVNPETPMSFANKQAIVKFILKDADGNSIQASSLTVGATGGYKFNVAYSIATESADEAYTNEASFTVTPAAATNEIYVAMPEISAFPILLTADGTDGFTYYYEKSGVSFTKGQYYEISVKMKRYKDLSKLTASYTAQDGDDLRGALASGKHLSIAGGASVTLNGVSITESASSDHSGITCQGSATIVLVGENSVIASADYYCGIEAGSIETTLTIGGDGSLTVSGGSHGAGIGGGGTACGAINITGGTINATGGSGGAGIGSGSRGTCGDITISGGTVTATGGKNAAGIGSGAAACGDIIISGGIVTATGGNNSASIGTGYKTTCGDITISGGNVTATGGKHAAGIGSGDEGTCSDITISGGTVSATAGDNPSEGTAILSAGIGSGGNGKFASITITSGISIVTATGAESNPRGRQPIGKSNGDNGSGTVTVDGVANWSGAETAHLSFSAGGVIIGGNQYMRWILTHK